MHQGSMAKNYEAAHLVNGEHDLLVFGGEVGVELPSADGLENLNIFPAEAGEQEQYKRADRAETPARDC